MTLAKILPITLLLLHLALADHHHDHQQQQQHHQQQQQQRRDSEEDDEMSNDLGLRFYDMLEMRADSRKSIENFALLSRNYPSRMNFRFASEDSRQIMATIERWDDEKTSRKCSFQPFDDEKATYNIKLWSMRKDLEIFEAIKIYKDPKDNMMDLFVMNMTDCKFNKMTLMKGYDYLKYRGTFMVFNPRDDKYFEMFWLNGKDECGSYMCRRMYYIENRTMSEPMRFELLNDDKQDWRLTFMAASSDKGYFSLIKQKMAIRLLSLLPDGSLISSTDEKIDSKLRFLRISTANDAFGACYIEDKKPREAQCMQLDRKLKVNINKTIPLDDEISYMAMYNLPKGGFVLMTARCAESKESMLEKKKERCDNYNMKMTKFKLDSTYTELMTFKEENCAPRRRQEFEFYEREWYKDEKKDQQLCMYYSCDCAWVWDKEDKIKSCDDTMRSKCLGDWKEL